MLTMTGLLTLKMSQQGAKLGRPMYRNSRHCVEGRHGCSFGRKEHTLLVMEPTVSETQTS